MNRSEILFADIDPKGFGLEIGPSYNPVAPKSKGYNVEVVDHLDQVELIKKYGGMGVDTSRIEFVDHVWQGQPLDELIGEEGRYDWIIASHVIEHVPDVISFLKQCQRLLKPDGALSLAIPDKRFSFDYFRSISSAGDLLDAYFQKRSRHPSGLVFDHFVSEVHLNGLGTWTKGDLGEPVFSRSLLDAKALLDYSLHPDAAYVDIHAWRFTPSSFRLILHDLNGLGILDFHESRLVDTIGCEFFASLRSNLKPGAHDRAALCRDIEREISEGWLFGNGRSLNVGSPEPGLMNSVADTPMERCYPSSKWWQFWK